MISTARTLATMWMPDGGRSARTKEPRRWSTRSWSLLGIAVATLVATAVTIAVNNHDDAITSK